MDSAANRFEALRARLREHAEKFPTPVRRVGDALWNERDEELSHAACLEQLPDYIYAELAGEPVAKIFPRVKHHLDRCNLCAQEYAELLDAEWAEQRGRLTKPAAMPRPNLSFLPESKRTLQQVVLERTRALLPTLAPAHLRELEVIADTFFARVQQLETFELRSNAVQAMGLGKRDTNPALNLLAASYAITQNLTRGITRAQFDEWLQQARLQQELETRANEVARDIGIERELAARFAHAYAEQIAFEPEALRALLHAD